MKNVMMVLFVILLLMGLTAPQVTAYSKHETVYQEQSKEPITDLGDGFEGRLRETDDAIILLVKLPAKYYSTNIETYIAGVQIGLSKILSCEALVCENGKPRVGITNEEKPILYVETKAGILPLIYALDSDHNLIGFAIRIPKEVKQSPVLQKPVPQKIG